MNKGRSELVRKVATKEYLLGRERDGQLKIRLGDLQEKLVLRHAFPRNHIRQIGTALESQKFTSEHGLKLEQPAGPHYKVDATIEYSFVSSRTSSAQSTPKIAIEKDPLLELSGILRGAIREGTTAFIKELRRDKVTKA